MIAFARPKHPVHCPLCGRRLLDAIGFAEFEIVCPRKRCKALVTVRLDMAAGGFWRGGVADPGPFERELVAV